MSTSAPPVATRQRRRGVRLLLAVGIPTLLVAFVVAVGGFRPAPEGWHGPELPANEPITLARWEIAVVGAEFVNRTLDDYETEDRIRVTLRLTWTGEASTYGMVDGLVEVRGIDTEAAGDPRTIGRERSGSFDPGVTQTVAFEVPYPDPDRGTGSTITPPSRVQVVIRDEKRFESYLGGQSWGLSDVIGHVSLDCPDRRERS